MKIIKKLLSIFLRISISIVLLIFLFKINKIKAVDLFAHIKSADKTLLLLAFFVFFFNYLFCLLRWIMLLKAVNIHIPFKRVTSSFAGGVFFNQFLPSTIGGDLMRSIDLSAHTQKPKEIVATVFLDRLSGYIGLVLFTFFSMAIGWKLVQDKIVLFSISIFTLVLVIILLILFNNSIYSALNRFLASPNSGRIRNAIKSLHEEIHVFRHKKVEVISNIFVSLLVQLTSVLTYYFTALSIGIKIKLIYFLVFIPIIGAITLLPISIGGVGLRDWATVLFFAKAGVARDLAFSMSLLNFLFILVYGAIGGLIYVLTVRHRRIQHHPPHGV